MACDFTAAKTLLRSARSNFAEARVEDATWIESLHFSGAHSFPNHLSLSLTAPRVMSIFVKSPRGPGGFEVFSSNLYVPQDAHPSSNNFDRVLNLAAGTESSAATRSTTNRRSFHGQSA